MKFGLGRVENIPVVGKGENAGNLHFLLFSQCFQKASFLRWLKAGIEWYRVKRLFLYQTSIAFQDPAEEGF